MSVKDFFDKGYSISSIRETSQDRLREDIESKRYVEAYIKEEIDIFQMSILPPHLTFLDLDLLSFTMMTLSGEYIKHIHMMDH